MVERIKHRLRQNRFLAPLMGRPYPAPRWNRAVKRVIRELGPGARILDLGSGTHRRAPNVINLEIEATPMVDVVADGHCLPFADNVFDAVISEAVLEHVQEPLHVVGGDVSCAKAGWICVRGGAVLAGVSCISSRLSTLDSDRVRDVIFSIL